MNTHLRTSIQEWTALVVAALFIGAALLTPLRALTPTASEAAVPQWDTIGPVADEHQPGFG